jgi:DNA-binding CsgD family transcriptional regulator
MDARAEEWLDEIADTSPVGDRVLPAAVLAAAARVRAAGMLAAEPPAQARVLGRSGRWLTVHASALAHGADGHVGVVVEPSRPVEVEPLVAAAYGLTPREREVLGGLLRGRSTAELAAALVVSPHTVEDHVKSIFERTGARSRQELAARIFYSHVEPRLHPKDPGNPG